MSKLHTLSILALAAILATILWQAPPSLLLDLSDEDNALQPQFPDAYLINTKTTQYNTEGDVSHIILADKVSHFKISKSNAEAYTLLEQPKFTFYNNRASTTPPWHASSKHARSLHQNEELLMTGDVILTQRNSHDVIATSISSEELLIKPNQQYAETNKPVIINTELGVTTAIGLKMSLASETIELLSNVRSRYESQ
jgi:lipopolysaccharide export system protein LptC